MFNLSRVPIHQFLTPLQLGMLLSKHLCIFKQAFGDSFGSAFTFAALAMRSVSRRSTCSEKASEA